MMQQTPTCHVEVIRDTVAFRKLQPEWDALWQSAGGKPPESYAVCHASLMALGPRHTLHCTVARNDTGELVGLWPAVVRRRLLWRYARQLAPDNGSPNDMLLAPGNDAGAIAAALWQAMLADAQPDLVHLVRVPADSPLRRLVAAGSVVHQEFENIPIARMRGATDWQVFRDSRRGRTRSLPEYLERRLAAQGPVELEIVGPGHPQLAATIDWLLRHKRDWAERGQIESRWLFSPAAAGFLHGCLLDDRGGLRPQRLFVLKLDGVPVAVNLIALQSGRATLEMNTYDAAFGKVSAGTILIDRCVRWAFAQGLDFDFGPGDQSYKQYWSQGVTERVLNLVLAPTRWGRLNRGALTFALRGRNALRDFRQSPTRAARKRPGLFAAAGAAVVGGMAFLMAEML